MSATLPTARHGDRKDHVDGLAVALAAVCAGIALVNRARPKT